MPAIFISYRRDGNSGYAGRLTDGLRACFGDDQVFRDSDDIAKGTSFEQEIRDALRSASVLLLLIGRRWLTLPDGAGRPRPVRSGRRAATFTSSDWGSCFRPGGYCR